MISLLEAPTFTPYVGASPGTTTMQLGAHKVYWNPYVTESRLRGLRGLGAPLTPGGIFALLAGATFAAVLGWTYYRSKK